MYMRHSMHTRRGEGLRFPVGRARDERSGCLANPAKGPTADAVTTPWNKCWSASRRRSWRRYGTLRRRCPRRRGGSANVPIERHLQRYFRSKRLAFRIEKSTLNLTSICSSEGSGAETLFNDCSSVTFNTRTSEISYLVY